MRRFPRRTLPVPLRIAATLAFLAALLCLPPSATAATKTWAVGTGQWDASGNWTPYGRPQAGDDVYLTQNDAADRTVTYYNITNPDALLNSLTIDATGTGAMTLDMPNVHSLNVSTEYVAYDGNGAITQSAGTNNAATLYLGYGAGSTGTYTLTGGTLSSSDSQYIGWYGTGILNILNGGQVSSKYGGIGYLSGGNGTVTVDGAGSKWANSSWVSVGDSGTGTLNIRNGGQVSNDGGGYLGYEAGSSGTVTVDGSGSNWINSWNLYVGNSGTGTLNIRNGGEVSNTDGYLGYEGGSSGTATVDGSGSIWTNSQSLFVGDSGTGTLNIQNGGQVSSMYGGIGYIGGGNGTVTVDGTGSKWANSSWVSVGDSGTGTLNIRNGGQVSNPHIS